MQEHGAAAPGDAWNRVVVDLHDEVVEMILACQAVAALARRASHWPVVVTIRRIFAPGILGTDGACGQKCPGTGMAVGAPPQQPGMEDAAGGAAVAFALVSHDPATPERDRYGPAISGEPA